MSPNQNIESGGSSPALRLLKENGRLAQQLLEAAPDAMVIVAEDGTIVLVNRQTEAMFGYSRSELLNRPVEMLIPERFRQRHLQHRAGFALKPHIRAMGQGLDLFGLYRDGTEFPVEIMISPIRFNGDLIISAAVRDVTDRQLLDTERRNQRLLLQRLLDQRSKELASKSEELEAAETMVSVGTVASGLIHDLNNALLPMRSRVDAMQRKATDQETQSNLATIDRTMDYIADLCKRIRMLIASDTSGSGDQATDLRTWWPGVQPLMAGIIPAQVQLQAHIPDHVPLLAVSRLDLTQAVFNLIHNASRALASRSKGTLTVSALPVMDHKVCLEIADDGPGMADELKERCLNAKYHKGKDHVHDGTGLGLMLVRMIIDRARGELHIESHPGQGTRISMIFPAAPSIAQVPRWPVPTSAASRPASKHM